MMTFYLQGYAQFGICISLLVHCIISGYIDLAALFIFGGLSALALVSQPNLYIPV
jgi:hypothetical protein